jgi:glycosyltransferase involved in cell wall biosynthesis
MEIILGDDCSTDKTGQVLDEYQNKYPEVFKKLYNEKNLGITQNLKRCLNACTGKYIAICEGDDYWTNDHKIQRQIQLLEAHPQYSMCFTAITLYNQQEEKYTPFSDQVNFPRDELTIEDLINVNYIGNFSCCMYRNSVVQKLPESLYNMFTVDWMFNMACSEMGKVGFIRESLSVYRKHTNGAWAGKSDFDQVSELIDLTKQYNAYFEYRYNDLFQKNLTGLKDWLDAKDSKTKKPKRFKVKFFKRLLRSIKGFMAKNRNSK